MGSCREGKRRISKGTQLTSDGSLRKRPHRGVSRIQDIDFRICEDEILGGGIMHDSSECPVCRGLPIDGSMSDDDFQAFLDGSMSVADWSMKIDDERFPIIPVGTHSPEQQTWLWVWVNESFPERAREASRQLQALSTLTGFRVFTDPGSPASSLDAQDFTAMAVHQVDAIGFFRAPSDGPTLYLAVQYPEAKG